MTEISNDKILPICELFVSIQGEGRFAGVPHIIVRLSGCNLNCMFSESICDTAYASWNPEKGKYSLTSVENLMLENPQIRYAFITGGEPTVHGKILIAIMEVLKSHNLFVAIETNGTCYLGIYELRLRGLLDFVTMSPKLTNSVPVAGVMAKSPYVNRLVTLEDVVRQDSRRSDYSSMKKWVDNFPHQVKFVVSNVTQLNEIQRTIDILGVKKENVYLMPEGDTPEKLAHRRIEVIEICLRCGYNYTDRLHILAWGNVRGV